jgi:fructose-specific phosphotransferase system IIC component
MVKKTFNPFKMWGAYLGVFIAVFITCGFSGIFTKICWYAPQSGIFVIPIIGTTPIVWIIGGFLLGWGIHSIFRVIRN